MARKKPTDRSLESLMRAFEGLDPEKLELAVSLIQRMSQTNRLKSPVEGLEPWTAKLKQEGFSERTIKLYRYLVGHFLTDVNREPTRLDVQAYLAKRRDESSDNAVRNEHKALDSFFSFLEEEKLSRPNPMKGMKYVRVRYRERKCPTREDVRKILGG